MHPGAPRGDAGAPRTVPRQEQGRCARTRGGRQGAAVAESHGDTGVARPSLGTPGLWLARSRHVPLAPT